jgi:hypothetical protein
MATHTGRISGSKVVIATICFSIALFGFVVGVAACAIEAGIVAAFIFGGLGAAVLCKSAM